MGRLKQTVSAWPCSMHRCADLSLDHRFPGPMVKRCEMRESRALHFAARFLRMRRCPSIDGRIVDAAGGAILLA